MAQKILVAAMLILSLGFSAEVVIYSPVADEKWFMEKIGEVRTYAVSTYYGESASVRRKDIDRKYGNDDGYVTQEEVDAYVLDYQNRETGKTAQFTLMDGKPGSIGEVHITVSGAIGSTNSTDTVVSTYSGPFAWGINPGEKVHAFTRVAENYNGSFEFTALSGWRISGVDGLDGASYRNGTTVFGTHPANVSITVTLEKNEPPVAKASVSSETASTGKWITFNASSSDPEGSALTYSWDFGDGTKGAGQTVSHEYTTPGTKTVVMTATDDAGGSMSTAIIVSITNNPPVANFEFAPSGVAAGEEVVFDASRSTDKDVADTLTYSWAWGDGGTGEGINARHRFSSPGKYSVTLTVSDGYDTADATRVVDVSSGGIPLWAIAVILVGAAALLYAIVKMRTKKAPYAPMPPQVP